MLSRISLFFAILYVFLAGCASQQELDQEKTDILKMGDMYYEKGDYAEAYDWYSDGIPLLITNTTDSSSSDYMGGTRYTFDTIQDTSKDNSVIKVSIDSKGEECFYKAMDCLVKLGKYNAVISRYEKYIQVFPNYSRIDLVIKNIQFIIEEYKKEEYEAGIMRANRLLISIDSFSKAGREAFFSLADYHFRTESYDYAIYRYDDILAYFPKDKRIPLVLFRLGVCHFSDFRGIYYDFSSIEKSEKYFKRFLARAPEGEDREKAEKYLAEITDRKASKALYKAKFYIRRNDYRAAGSYLREIREQYPKTSQASQAEVLLSEIAQEENND